MERRGPPALRGDPPLEAKTRVKALLDARGIRYSWLAARLGITPSQFTHYEAGHYRYPPGYHKRIAEILGVPIEWVRPDPEPIEVTA